MQREGDRQPLVDSSVDLISKALADLNDISKSLDSDLIKSNGLIHALKYETDIISRSGQLQIDIQLTGEPRYMDADRELVIFRIIQEAFNNIVKHAAASRVILRLDYAPGGLHLSIQDNGRGFDAAGREQRNEGRRGAGLKNIKNRAHMLQAILGISSGPGEGTTINLDIPYDSNLTDAKRSN
jgi:signal transduction histidine kinase